MIFIYLEIGVIIISLCISLFINSENYKNKEKYKKNVLFSFIFCVMLYSPIVLGCFVYDIIKKQKYEKSYTWTVSGTNIKFKDMDNIYRCYGGVTYIKGFTKYNNTTVLVDENGKPRKCY